MQMYKKKYARIYNRHMFPPIIYKIPCQNIKPQNLFSYHDQNGIIRSLLLSDGV
jgi:hypothetical protein